MRSTRFLSRLGLLVLVLGALALPAAAASDSQERRERHRHDRAMRVKERHRVRMVRPRVGRARPYVYRWHQTRPPVRVWSHRRALI